jgi:DNA-binding response OmpR family regulator
VADPKLLIVEDDETIGATLARVLASDYDVTWVREGRAALDAVDPTTALVVLDLGLPDIDGIDVCRTIVARHPELPILILTARADEIDVIIGLDAGAVDYLAKPFRLGELQARLRVHSRRRPDGASQEIGALRIDTGARRAWIGDRELELRVKEFELLVHLSARAGRVVSREELMTEVWDQHWFGSTKTLDVHMVSLRRKLLGDDGVEAVAITTVRGVGYRLERP